MCRLIFARGDFAVADIMAAAVAMSCGETARHDNASKSHPHGWGAVWRDPVTGQLRSHRDERAAADSIHDSPLSTVRTDTLAVHVRKATLMANRGIEFTHPLSRPDDDWLFMHNGYMPTVHRLVDLPDTAFDSAAYFRYLVPPGTDRLVPERVVSRLAAIPAGGSSGNAIAMSPQVAQIIHWSPPDCGTPVFFTMYRLHRPGADIVASEIVPSLAPADHWQPLAADSVLTYHLDREGAS